MRSAIIAALSALVALAMVSAAFAQTDQGIRTNHPIARDKDNSQASGLTTEQEDAVPYRPCMEALGWVNGRLRCSN
jgi:hypothetical protein